MPFNRQVRYHAEAPGICGERCESVSRERRCADRKDANPDVMT